MGRRSGKDIKAASLAVYLATIGADLRAWPLASVASCSCWPLIAPKRKLRCDM